ncbi:MAG: hypothetical protein R2844_05795 [Caldilineales bacterium]
MIPAATLIDIGGWIGAVALLLAYALVSNRRLAGDSIRFQSLNLLGSVLLALNSGYHGAMPSVVVNGVWILIGAVALVRARRDRGQRVLGTE